jgi:hypothetical protein
MESEGKKEHRFVPDVKITTPENGTKPKKKSGGVAVTESATENEPLMLRAFVAEEHRERFVEIYEAGSEEGYGERLVTTVEVLSPSNKRPGTEGWEQYQSKRQSVLLSGVNLVEIDLLRGGQRPPMLDPWPKSPYTLLVARGVYRYERCKVWRASFQRPLLEIFVPLAEPDADVPLRLQPMIEAVYKRARYGRAIDYNKPLKPPLRGAEAAWMKAHLREWQRQS